jgi:translocation and assembly module TamB
MKLIIKYILISSLLLCAIALFLLCGTTKGLILDLQYLSRFLPGQIRVEHVSGTLFSAFSLKNISYQYAGQTMTIQSLDVAWHPSKLFQGQLAFDTLSIKEAHIQLIDYPTENRSTTNTKAILSKLNWLHFITFNQFILDNLSLQKGKQWITLQGNIDQYWNVKWAFNCPNINALVSDVKGSLQGIGTISGLRLIPNIHVTINGKQFIYGEQTLANFNARADIALQPDKNSYLSLKASGIRLECYLFDQINLNTIGSVKRVKKELLTTLQLNVSDHFKLNMALSLPQFSGFYNIKQPIRANIIFTATDLSLLDTLIPDIKNTRGILNGNIILRGTFKKPEFTSGLKLTKGSFSLPLLGISPNNISAEGQIDNTFNLIFKGTLRSGNGSAKLQGHADLTNPEFPLTLAVQGNQIDIIQLPEYKVSASPDITLLLSYPSLQLKGNVIIPYADIKPKNISTAISLPEEVIFVNEIKPKTKISPILLSLQLSVNLGNSVNVDYDNLKAKLLGNITIEKISDSPPKASGELYTAHGTYTAYGQTLTIETGRLIYTGNPLMNPGLNIRAIKEVRRVVTQNASSFVDNTSLQNIPFDTEMVKVGVQVAGTADNPKISLFSVPPDLSQGDILSYLLLGLPQSQASSAQGSALFTALSAYNPNASNVLGLTNQLQHKLGLNELNVESVETFNPSKQSVESTTSFVVGKQITQKISIHYSIGLFNPISILNLRYQISPHWAVQSETSTIDSGADLLYGFERD